MGPQSRAAEERYQKARPCPSSLGFHGSLAEPGGWRGEGRHGFTDSAHAGFVLTSKSEGRKGEGRKNLNKEFPKKLPVKKK